MSRSAYQAFYIAIGCQGGKRPGVENDDAPGTEIAVSFLEKALGGKAPAMPAKVVVIGGGNVAIDCARTAKRLGAAEVSMYCLESRETMPASPEEIREAEEDGVSILPSWGPKKVRTAENGHVSGLTFKRCLSTIDPQTKKFSPKYDENETVTVDADYVIFAISQGHEAAESLARCVSENNVPPTLARDRRYFKALDRDNVAIDSYDHAQRQVPPEKAGADREAKFSDPRGILTEEQVHTEASRCLSCGRSVVDPHKCMSSYLRAL